MKPIRFIRNYKIRHLNKYRNLNVNIFMKFMKITLFISILFVMALVTNDYLISQKAQGYLFSNLTDIPNKKVGLVLGTSKYMPQGGINLYYAYRIDAAVALFRAGKIDYILVSGDNSHISYNEPDMFKKDLIKRGVPENKIVLDYAGFRTLDSVVRAKEVFGQDTMTIISQQFQNERALYIANNYGIRAIAFNAKDVNSSYGIKTKLREYLARSKAYIDVLVDVQPKFLGEKIPIG